jgi:Zn-dependent peptidase ImmA (M78 family)
MKWTITTVRQAFGGRLVGGMYMKKMVCQALLVLPSELIEQVSSKVWFISSSDDAWAMTFKGTEIKDRHLIFLSEDLLRQDTKQIYYTILHEIGHVVLNHRNSIGYTQTETEIKHQEIEADRFAKTYVI